MITSVLKTVTPVAAKFPRTQGYTTILPLCSISSTSPFVSSPSRSFSRTNPITKMANKSVAPRTALAETDGKGAFVRKDSVFRNFIEKGTRFEPEGKLSLLIILILTETIDVDFKNSIPRIASFFCLLPPIVLPSAPYFILYAS